MTRLLLTGMASVLLLTNAMAQQPLYTPRNLSRALAKHTRSGDGRPGKNYWQNKGRYDISITAMPPSRTIRGTETITYFNNSPDTLGNLIIKLFLNIHKPGAPRDGGTTIDYLNQGMIIDSLAVNGKATPWRENPYLFTWQPLRLPQSLLPGDSIHLSFKWHYEISLKSEREGMIDSTTYFLAYFYPRIAVYDDYNGWDRMNFTEGKEFYSDFNDYKVTFSVPKNYIVWGTGTLQHPETVLQPDVLRRYQQAFSSNETITIAGAADLKAGRVTTGNPVNHWQFTATDIPDMAFGLSDHFVWDGCSVVVDDATGRRAGAFAAYNDTARDYHQVARYARHALNWLSHQWPGVPYPYEKTTVFQGYAGMEYPMMANDETYEDSLFSRFVAEHEIAHTYMPFYMGINETRYGFMDEGWATTLELLIGQEDLGREKAEALFKQFRVSPWILDPAQEEDLPIINPGDAMSGPGLGNNEYGKAALGYLAAKDLLGDALFKKCLHAYMERWHGKHPSPWDFFYTFNNVAGKNLNWFWSSWFFSNHYIDFAIEKAVPVKNGYQVVINNTGGMPAPVDIVVEYTDGARETIHQTPALWATHPQQAAVVIPSGKKIRSVQLSGGIFMDADESNNRVTLK